ncbi:unnamed protein product, partial [Gordionus sp. m RMFG-2023]
IEHIMKSKKGSSVRYDLYKLAHRPSTVRETITQKSILTATEAQAALKSFIDNYWLQEDKDEKISLSQRSILELEPYLKVIAEKDFTENSANSPSQSFTTFDPNCYLCKKFCTKYEKCPNCSVKIHPFCHTKFVRNIKSENVTIFNCPSCEF